MLWRSGVGEPDDVLDIAVHEHNGRVRMRALDPGNRRFVSCREIVVLDDVGRRRMRRAPARCGCRCIRHRP